MEPTRLDRRELLKTATAAAAAGLIAGRARPAAAQAVKWSSGTEAPKLKAPANATDCHHHIYDAKYRSTPRRRCAPPTPWSRTTAPCRSASGPPAT